MTELAVGQAVPDFTSEATNDTTVALSALKGKNVVIYFLSLIHI